jgi:hypothetical protein
MDITMAAIEETVAVFLVLHFIAGPPSRLANLLKGRQYA